MANPFLSIGIIFRDDIRCIERCLKSLAPLREALPCELVMADTGSADGSREVAERYADILFDFPWINNFAAARNAVMDRCTGRWYFTVDTDEWLDEDITELVRFIRTNNKKAGEVCLVFQRNYMSVDDETQYQDFMAVRLLRMSTGMRYHNAIHEQWAHDDGSAMSSTILRKTILHHDGYIGLNTEAGAAKRKRNMDLLLQQLEEDPEDLRALLQCIESAGNDAIEYVRRGVDAVEAKREYWETYGPAIFRYAVGMARIHKLEELEEWAARAKELFPQSFYILIDNSYIMFHYHWKVTKDYDECIRLGETYLRAMEDYNTGRGNQLEVTVSTLTYASPNRECTLRTMLAHVYCRTGQPEHTLELMDTLDFSLFDENQTKNCVLLLRDLHRETEFDTAPLALRLYEGICKPTPSEKRAEERKKTFERVASGLFNAMEEEERTERYTRYSCSSLAPLAGRHPLGDAVAVLEAETASEKERLLAAAERPYAMPVEVLRRAILSGISFPLEGKPMNLESMGALAEQMAQKDGPELLSLALDGLDGGLHRLAWAKSVAQGVVSAWNWEEENEQSMELARVFARLEKSFISRCYTPESLSEENIVLLPPMHRLGWYCGRAFAALDAGDPKGYVRCLRTALESTPNMKAMVSFLAEHTPELQTPPKPSAELLALAEQVRTLLSNFAPDDPTVAALKQSEAYQEVAYFIEGAEVPVMGGLSQ